MMLPLEKVASSNYQRSTYFFSSAVSAFLKAPVSFSSVVFVRQYGYSWKSAAKYNPSKKEKIRHLPKRKEKNSSKHYQMMRIVLSLTFTNDKL